MKRLLINLWLLVVLSAHVLVAGCSKEVSLEDRGNTGNGQTEESLVKLSLQLPGQGASRALTQTQEDAIQTVDILVFDRNDNFFDWRHGNMKVEGNTTSVEALLVSSQRGDANDRYRIVVLANAREKLYALFKSTDGTVNKPGGSTLNGYKEDAYADVTALITDLAPLPAPDASKGIPMWGELEQKQTITHGAQLGNLTLYRALARIDVGTYDGTIPANGVDAWTALDNFKIEEVQLYNTQGTYRYCPLMSSFSFSQTVNIIAPSPVTGASVTTVSCTDIVKNNDNVGLGVMRGLYMTEADVIMNGTYGDEKHLDRPCILVKGYYKPVGESDFRTQASWYRIDFVTGTSNTTLHNVLRNHNYQVVITNVAGPGQTSRELAIKTFNTDLTATIKTWTNANQSATAVDGQNWMTIGRKDITTDKWAKNGEELEITTNISAGWSATVTEGTDWLTLTDGTTVTGVSGDILKFNIQQIPSATTTRTGKIRITAGNMSLSALVTQTDDDSDFRLRLSHGDFLIPGRVWDGADWTAPDARTLSVDWAPRVNDFGMSLSSYVGGGVEGFSPGNTSNNPNVAISLDMIDPQSRRVQDDPFYERSSLLTVTAWDLLGTRSISKQVLIRQVFYSLVVTGAEDYYFQGKTYTFNVKSNSAWVAEVSGDDIFAADPGASGTGNTSTGENFSFTIANSAAANATATITFRSPGNLFPSQEFTIVAQDELPNSYFLTPGSGEREIPVRKAYRVWKYDRDLKEAHTNGDLPSGSKQARLLWQDAPGLIQDVEFRPAPAPGVIKVTAGTGSGNAVVAFTIDGQIYWSWHIWVTDESSIGTHSVSSQTIMDRNLGATNATPGNTGTIGLYFQGGRKDPFSLINSFAGSGFRPLYSDTGTLPGTAAGGGIYTGNAPATGGLPVSIQNPTQIMAASYGTLDWYGPLSDMRTYLWGPVIKTDYDPCPTGWRVANESIYAGTSASNVTYTAANYDYQWNGIHFPAQGAISVDGRSFWQRALYSWNRYASNSGVMMTRVFYNTGVVGGNGSRGVAAPVRCIRN
ncbi:fimbrial protein [uncultured Alistipes sp.]|jgi:fibrobacter succinogenes major domain (fib_succ_major)|uniref:fimbrial protein n=1 Tax=uncultured Alistipes sp. TaxID=538949 RepID=UPI0027D96A21|nr:fimbrial protein [uncultured Alistipes sp.]